MGYYIETGTALGKSKILQETYDAKVITKPHNFDDIPVDKALVCVVSNGAFEAAGYCWSAREFDAFTSPTDLRPKTWLLMDKQLAEKLSGFTR